VKRFQGKRIERIAWKIVRGLYCNHHGIILPAEFAKSVSLTPLSQGEKPPDHFLHFMAYSKEAYGRYPGVFSYRFENFVDANLSTHYWALLLWDSILITAIFHDPTCRCAECSPQNPSEDAPKMTKG
jgi:hypothetical protein